MFNFITDVFKSTKEKYPEKRAIADSNRALTFSQVYDLSEKISGSITSKSEFVGVMAHRDVYTVPMFFGVSMSGRCYVPLDPSLPASKLSKIIKNAGITEVLSFNEQDGEKLEQTDAKLLVLNENLEYNGQKTDFCSKYLYVVYTSGSTGEPKGVLKSHNAMKNFTDAYISEFSFDSDMIIGNQTPFYFDASAKDIYLMAACGATIEIIPTEHFSFPVNLVKYMNERKINFISWVPSALTIVSALGTFKEIKPEYLKRVCFVGEAFATKHLNKWMDALPETEFVNLYGSSEICGISCFYRIPDKIDEDKNIPIGKALSNCDVKLVDGEIYVCSQALADGYFADEQKTANSFIQADLGSGLERYYKTGDIAKYDDNGLLVFMSRSDYQIKHMGHRIELGEIETAALSMDKIEKCCCLYDSKKSRIILFVQPSDPVDIQMQEIRAYLREKLSEYMLPHRVKIFEKLPLNRNGKIDRAMLQNELK